MLLDLFVGLAHVGVVPATNRTALGPRWKTHRHLCHSNLEGIQMRTVLWTKERGTVHHLAHEPEAPSQTLTPAEAKLFAKGIRRERRAHAERLAGKHTDRSRQAVKQSGGFVMSGWRNLRSNMRQSKAIVNVGVKG